MIGVLGGVSRRVPFTMAVRACPIVGPNRHAIEHSWLARILSARLESPRRSPSCHSHRSDQCFGGFTLTDGLLFAAAKTFAS